jgi:hypothetical protein
VSRNADEVRVAAVRELARRELDRRQQPTQARPTSGKSPWWLHAATAAATAGLPGGGEEAVTQMATGSAASALGGLAGLAGTILPGGQGQGSRWSEAVRNFLTYQPRTPQGRAASEVIGAPFALLERGADKAGGAASAGTGSPLVGTAVKTGIEALPMLFGLRGRAPVAATQPEVLARNFVETKTGLTWDGLSDAVKARLTQIAGDAETLGKLDPAAVERQLRLESLPVPIRATRGQIIRDPVQLTNEGTLAATETGRSLRSIRDAQSPAIVQNLEVLKGRVRGRGETASKAETPEQVGLSLQDAALRAKLRGQQKKVKELYGVAEQVGEMRQNVSTMPLRALLDEGANTTNLGWVRSWLDTMRNKRERLALSGREPGQFVAQGRAGARPIQDRNSVTLKELEDLRRDAVGIAASGGSDAYFAGKVIRKIDEMTEGAGGEAYARARAARKAQALEFEDQGAVARLVENKPGSRTDRATALEDTWRKTVLGGSIEDLQAVRRSLLTGENAAVRVAGRRAWRDIRAQTIQYLIDESTKSAAVLPDGSAPVSAAAMQQALKSIGPQKLETIFGRGTVKRIDEIMKATRDVRTEPPRIHPGSSTMGNVVAFLERSLGTLPVLGDVAGGAIRTVGKLRELGRAGREIRDAETSPLTDAQNAAQRANLANPGLRRGLLLAPSEQRNSLPDY